MADTETTLICKHCGTRFEYGTSDVCPNCGFEVAYQAITGAQVLPPLKPLAPAKSK